MADTKISDLTGISGGTLASGDKFAVADASDLTVSYSCTMGNIATYAWNAPTWAAGSASANTWPKFTSGTVLTTAEVGAVELDANCFYMTTDAGNRGAVQVMHIIRQDASRNLTSSVAEQQLFNSATNGRLTLETGCYMFECQFSLSGMSATSGNAAFDILGAGTSTLGTVLYHVVGIDGATATAATQTGSTSSTAQTAASAVTAGTATAMQCHMRGTFEVTAAGTIQPAVTLVTAAAATVAAGSYFMCYRVGSTTLTTIGQWD